MTDAADALTPYLEPGETLAWSGVPDRAAFGIGGGCLAALGAPLLALGVALAAAAPRADFEGRWIMLLLGLSLVGVGLMLVVPPLWDAWLVRHLVYGVSDRRVLLLRRGRRPHLRAYGPEVLGGVTLPLRSSHPVDVPLGVDHAPREVMPSTGKLAGPVGVVGLVAVPQAAVRAVGMLVERAGPAAGRGLLRATAVPTERLLAVRGELASCRQALEAGLARHREAARGRARRATLRAWLLAAPGALAGVAIFEAWTMDGALPAFLLVGSALAAAAFARVRARDTMAGELATIQRAEGVAKLLDDWREDAFAGAPVEVQLDLREAHEVPASRHAESPSSKALKSYHTHRWARLVWVTACGSPVELVWIERVKLKGGHAVARRGRLHGRLVPNPAVWDVARLQPRWRAGPLNVETRRVAGAVVLGLRGAVNGAAHAAEALADVYRSLPRHGPG